MAVPVAEEGGATGGSSRGEAGQNDSASRLPGRAGRGVEALDKGRGEPRRGSPLLMQDEFGRG